MPPAERGLPAGFGEPPAAGVGEVCVAVLAGDAAGEGEAAGVEFEISFSDEQPRKTPATNSQQMPK